MGSSSGSDSGSSGATDTGDMGSEAANNAATDAANASVGAGGGSSDTGDLGSEAANNAATQAANESVGIGADDPGITVYSYTPEEMAEQQLTAAQLSYDLGLTQPTDPSPTPTDTITSYTKNLMANIKSNPIGFAVSPTGTALKTAAQTVAANYLTGNITFGTTDTGEGTGTITGEGNGEIPVETVLPYIIGGGGEQPSEVLSYFGGLQQQPSLLSRYGQAKQTISSIIGDIPSQYGYQQPMQSNFYYDYLTRKGLL